MGDREALAIQRFSSLTKSLKRLRFCERTKIALQGEIKKPRDYNDSLSWRFLWYAKKALKTAKWINAISGLNQIQSTEYTGPLIVPPCVTTAASTAELKWAAMKSWAIGAGGKPRTIRWM
jgi:hypothetical protein